LALGSWAAAMLEEEVEEGRERNGVRRPAEGEIRDEKGTRAPRQKPFVKKS